MNTRMLLLLVLLALFLVACGAQGPQQEEPSGEEPGEVTRVVTETVVEEGEAVEVTRIATESPAEEAEEPPASPPPEESPTSPAPAATPIATQERPPATPPALEHRAEVEWPPRMRLGESDVVRLSLLPSEDGYVVATNFPEHRTVTETVTLEPTGASNRNQILNAIYALQPEGSTNAEAGLRLGYQMANQAYRAGGTNRVILASDGVANVGLTDPDGLAAQIRSYADGGIRLTTIGVGMGNFNDVLMEQLADQGDGHYAGRSAPRVCGRADTDVAGNRPGR